MAHVEKYTRSQTGQLCQHYERKKINGEYVKFGNENIDLTKTHLNYNLAPEHNQIEFIKNRCEELNCFKRKDVNVMCSWVVTKPKDLSAEHEEDFFKNTYKFLEDRYGKDNIVSSYVHMDEVTPHMHFVFVPVVYDKKKERYKISAKERINKLELKSFHQDLDKYLEQNMGFKVNVLNEMTKEGNKSIEELKRGTAIDRLKAIEEQLQSIKYQLEPLKAEYEAKRGFLKQIEKNSDISTMYPDYAEISKKGILKKEEYVTVPKKKWEEKHISANQISAWHKEHEILEKMIKDFKSFAEELGDIDKLKAERNSLKRENEKLYKEVEGFAKIFNKLQAEHPELFKVNEKIQTKEKDNSWDRGR